jgi:hypothetical protein
LYLGARERIQLRRKIEMNDRKNSIKRSFIHFPPSQDSKRARKSAKVRWTRNAQHMGRAVKHAFKCITGPLGKVWLG